MPDLKFFLLLTLFFQQAPVFDETRVRFHEAIQSASTEGIPSLVRKLEALFNASPSSPAAPLIYETLTHISLTYPGSISAPKLSGSVPPAFAAASKRIEVLQSYYGAALKGRAESSLAALSDPVFDDSPFGLQARADAALRTGDCGKATSLAMQVIETDPQSPLLSSTYMILGLSSSCRGDYSSALMYFQRARAASELPTIYGDPKDHVFAAYRFSRKTPTAGNLFDEAASLPLAAGIDIKDPQAMIPAAKGYTVLDKEMVFAFSPEGKITDKKPARKVKDIAAAKDGKIYAVTDDTIDFGQGPVRLSLASGKKAKQITHLCSLATGLDEDVYLLDEESGLLHAATAAISGSVNAASVAPVKGRLVRMDGRGNLYVLAEDQKSILVISREGKALGSISADPVAGKVPAIEYFAFDPLNHLYLLLPDAIQAFVLKNGAAGLEKKGIGSYTLDQRPSFRNLKVIVLGAGGAVVALGKNDNNWVTFK